MLLTTVPCCQAARGTDGEEWAVLSLPVVVIIMASQRCPRPSAGTVTLLRYSHEGKGEGWRRSRGCWSADLEMERWFWSLQAGGQTHQLPRKQGGRQEGRCEGRQGHVPMENGTVRSTSTSASMTMTASELRGVPPRQTLQMEHPHPHLTSARGQGRLLTPLHCGVTNLRCWHSGLWLFVKDATGGIQPRPLSTDGSRLPVRETHGTADFGRCDGHTPAPGAPCLETLEGHTQTWRILSLSGPPEPPLAVPWAASRHLRVPGLLWGF